MTYQRQFTLATSGHRHLQDLTDRLADLVSESGVRTGVLHLFNVGSTAAVGTIEFEPGLEHDLPALLDELIPPSLDYRHEQAWHDGNGHAHLQATWLGPSLGIPIVDGRLALGEWQQVFHLECDVKPRRRTLVVTIVGE